MDTENDNTITVPSESMYVAIRMKPCNDGDMRTIETTTEPFEAVKEFLSSKELRRPYRPEDRKGDKSN